MQVTMKTPAFLLRILGLPCTAAAYAARDNAAESFSMYIPGRGPAGYFATIEQAEQARQRLTNTQRQRAIICDADGNALTR